MTDQPQVPARIQQLVDGYRERRYRAVRFHPEDPNAAALEVACRDAGLVPVPDPAVTFRSVTPEHSAPADLTPEVPDSPDRRRVAAFERMAARYIAAAEPSKPPFEFQRGEGEWFTIEDAVHQALAAATVCWDHPERAGALDGSRVKAVADALLEEIRGLLR